MIRLVGEAWYRDNTLECCNSVVVEETTILSDASSMTKVAVVPVEENDTGDVPSTYPSSSVAASSHP